jgi:hypothetical protein
LELIEVDGESLLVSGVEFGFEVVLFWRRIGSHQNPVHIRACLAPDGWGEGIEE